MLSWVRLPGAEHCPDLRSLMAQVNAHLQRAAFVSATEAELLIEASVEPTPSDVWKIRIALADATGASLGTRELVIEQRDCADAVEATALPIALMIDPDAALRAAQPATAPSRAVPVSPTSSIPPPSLHHRRPARDPSRAKPGCRRPRAMRNASRRPGVLA